MARLARIPDFAAFLAGAEDGEAFVRLRAAESIGRPLSDERFLAWLDTLDQAKASSRQARAKADAAPVRQRILTAIKCTVTVIRRGRWPKAFAPFTPLACGTSSSTS